ncbi:MAG: DUF3794 domain-containing protein [Clostridiales bacterium]|nr:DUF3794 domain-containing protein [Clostridiales bacterium]
MDIRQENSDKMNPISAKEPEVLREELSLTRYLGESLRQAVVEGEVALPGGLREETVILSAEAMAVIEKTAVQTGRVDVDGKVIFHVLYTQGDPTHISSLEAAADFSQTVEMPGARPGMNAPVSLMPEHVEASAQGGRLKLMAILRLFTRLFSDDPISVVSGLRAQDGLMQKTEVLKTSRTVASGVQDVLVRDECELSDVLQITDTLYATAAANVQEVMGGEERATISGSIELEVTHLSAMPSRPLVITRHSIPFEETLSLIGENGDQLTADAIVKDVAVLSQEGQEEGQRTLRAEVLLSLSAQTTQSRDVCLLLDAYTTQGDLLKPATQPTRRVLAQRQVHTAESGKLTLLLDGQPPARTPLTATLRPIITDLSKTGGKLNVEGMMEVCLLYMTDDTAVPQSYRTEEPFRMSFACDLSCPEAMVLQPTGIEVAGVTSDRVEVKYILHLCCYDVTLGQEPLVSDLSREPAPEEEQGLLLYFSQPGESLWDIAKRYRVSCDSLRRMNPSLEGDAVPDGQRVILWRRG